MPGVHGLSISKEHWSRAERKEKGWKRIMNHEVFTILYKVKVHVTPYTSFSNRSYIFWAKNLRNLDLRFPFIILVIPHLLASRLGPQFLDIFQRGRDLDELQKGHMGHPLAFHTVHRAIHRHLLKFCFRCEIVRLSDCHRLSYFNGLFGSSSFPSKAGDVSTNAPRRTRFMAHGTVRFRLIRHERLPRTSGFLSTRLSRCNTGESLDILQMYRHQTETNLMNFNDLCNDMCLWQLLPQPFHHCFARETRAMAFVQVRALPVTGSFVRSEGLSLSPKRPQQRLGWNRQMKDSAIYNFVRIFSCSCFVQQYLAHDVSQMSVVTHTYLHYVQYCHSFRNESHH